MEVLNSQSFANVLTRCYENSRYRAAVVFTLRSSFKLFVDEVRGTYVTEAIPGVERVVPVSARVSQHQNSLRIQYENGSIIEAFVINPNSRGKRYNEIIYDEDVDTELLRQILQPMLIPYKVYESAPDYGDEEFDTKELDEFLKSLQTTP